MLGQETPARLQTPSRAMTPDQVRMWARAVELADDTADRLVLLRMYGELAAIQWAFAQQHGLTMLNPADLEAQAIDLETGFAKVRDAMRGADDHRYAVVFRGGDIDIVELGEDLGGILLVIAGVVAGVVIVAGLVAGLIHYKNKADEIKAKYNPLVRATDQMFCKEGSPDTCAEWKRYRKEQGYTEKLTVLDKLEKGLDVVVGTGAKWAGILIPVLIGLWLWSTRKK